MEDPVREIGQVVLLVTAAVNPDIQDAAVARYYAPDAAFRHPLCAVPSAPASRDAILAILHWYRVLSPHIAISVRSVTYNPDAHQLFLDIDQIFHLRWSPFKPTPARLLTRLTLRPDHPADGPPRFLIAEHQDFYHPDDFIALLVPPLAPLVRAALAFASLQSALGARLGAALGFWTAAHGEDGRGEPLPPADANKKDD